MATAETLTIKLETVGADQAQRALGSVDTALGHVEQSAAKTGAAIGAMAGVTTVGLNAVTAALGGLGGAAQGLLSLSSQLEQSRIAFTSMLGSAQQAEAFLKDLQQFAATTPFEFPGLVDASKKMLAFGFTAEQVRPLLTAVGNAAAAMGSGQEGIDRITRALGQMQAKGQVAAEEILQLTEAGIPAWDMLAKKLGVDVVSAMDMVEKRTVSAATFMAAFQEGTAARFGDMMAAQSKTFAGAMSTVRDSAQMAAVEGLDPLFKVATDVAVALANMTQSGDVETWAARIKVGAQGAADALRQVPLALAGAGGLGGDIQNIAQASGIPQLAGLLAGPARAAGIDVGGLVAAGVVEGIRLSPAGAVPALADLLGQLRDRGAATAEQEAKRIGADFVQNVAAAIAAEAPAGADAFGAVAERLIREFEGRGFDPETARQAASQYFDAVLVELERRRPDMTEAGERIGGALVDGTERAVINASGRIASAVGAALQASKGNIEAAIGDVLGREQGPAAEQAVAQILQRANAYKAVTEALNTLTPAERARYEVLLLANGAADKVNQSLAVLNDMLATGKITQEQYTSALDRGSVGLQRQEVAAQRVTTAVQAQTQAVQQAAQATEALGRVRVDAGAATGAGSNMTRLEQTTGTPLSAGQQAAISETGGGAPAPVSTAGSYGPNVQLNPAVNAYLRANPQAGLARAGETVEGAMLRVAQTVQQEQGAANLETAARTKNYDAVEANTAATQRHTTVLEDAQAAQREGRALTVAQANALDRATQAANASTQSFYLLDRGTGLAANKMVVLTGALTGASAAALQAQLAQEAARQEWAITADWARNLRAGTWTVGGVQTGPGLSTSQLYGNTATALGQGFTPGTLYGLPVMSPITPGTLYGHAGGGTVSEPSYLVSMRSGRAWGSIAERGPETVIPHGSGATVNITVYAGMGAGDVLKDRAFWEAAWRQQIQPAAQLLGARV